MRRASWMVAVAVLASLAATALYAQRPSGSRGRMEPPTDRGQRGPGAFVERAVFGSWAFVSLELDTSDEQLVQLRKVYREYWAKTREKLAGFADVPREERQAAMQELIELQRALREAVRELLTEEQAARLDEWYRRQMPRRRSRPSQRPGTGGSE